MAVSTGNPFVIDQSSMGAGLGALGKAAGGFLGQQAQQEQASEQQALAEHTRDSKLFKKGCQYLSLMTLMRWLSLVCKIHKWVRH